MDRSLALWKEPGTGLYLGPDPEKPEYFHGYFLSGISFTHEGSVDSWSCTAGLSSGHDVDVSFDWGSDVTLDLVEGTAADRYKWDSLALNYV